MVRQVRFVREWARRLYSNASQKGARDGFFWFDGMRRPETPIDKRPEAMRV